MNSRAPAARRKTVSVSSKLLACVSVVIPCLLASSGAANAGKVTATSLEQIEGFKSEKQIASPHVFFVSLGPSLPESELKRQDKLLPQWVMGAGYRVAFLGQDKYVDLVVELIASGEEGSPKKTISSYWISGSDIEEEIGTQGLNVVSLKRWIDYRTLLLEGGSIGSSPAEDIKKAFTITIRDGGVIDIDPAPKGHK